MRVSNSEYNHDVGDREVLGSHMDYDWWQAKLSEEFFPLDQPDEPVIMFLDDDEMVRICPDLPDPVISLRSAVLAELRQTDTTAIFEPLDRRMATWRKGPQDQPPPSLPLLAITVIAGSRMRNDGAFSSAAYYPRLLSLMTSGRNSLTATGIQKHFDVVADMWQTLDDWIGRNDDFLGPSTIHTHQTFNRIGYPLSQTVLKASDRERLSGFFDRIRVDRSSTSSPTQLLALLRLWMDKPRGFSTTFVDLVQKGQGDPLLLAVISKLAAEQSGPPVAKGRVRLDLRMCIDPEDWSISWMIPVDPRLEMDELRQDNGSLFSIRKPDYGSVYDVVSGSLPQGAPLINKHFRAAGTRAFLTKKVRDIWILRIDPSSGQWLSVPEATPDEPHLLVVRDTDVAEMEELLTKNAASGYWKFRGKLFPGWTVYVDVSWVEPIDLSTAGAFNSLGQLLKAPPNSRPKLVNGLQLRTDVGGLHYLQGGEPDVQLPEDSSNESVDVVLDKRLPGTRLKANGSLFPLRVAGPFTEGKHTVSVAGVTLDFFVHTSGSAAQWEAARTEGADDAVPPGPVREAETPEYVLCRRGRNAAVWFVSPSGLVRRRSEPPVPLFITRLGFPQSYQWKVSVPRGTAWVLTERAGKLSQPQRISSDPPNFGSLDGHSQEFWRRVARETINNKNRLWRSYLSQSMEDSIYGR